MKAPDAPGPQMALSTLTQLSNLISQSVATLERISTETGIALPDLDNPTIAVESEVLRTNAAAIEAARVIAAAGLQLAALTMPPKDYVFEVVFGAHLAASLRVCMEANATEILREAGPNGLHADKIAEQSHIDGGKLARIMRHLASHHIYREVEPDTFANNRLSATLDTKKPVAKLFSDPDNKHTGTSDAFPAAAAWTLDLWAKAACNLWETLKDPEVGFSNETIDSTWHRTLGISVPFHRWFEQPSQRKLRTLFGIAIKGYAEMNPPSTVLDAFPWTSLPDGAVVVDVGGGIGSAALCLAQKHPHLRVIVQDLPEVAANAQKSWEVQFLEVHQFGQVTFEGHDFFTPQPVHNASVFFLRYIVHNWSDPYVRKILTHLRGAATPDTTLVVVDHILPYACPQETLPPDVATLSEALDTAAPPLLPNFGAANALGHSLDSLMLVNLNAQERNIGHLKRLLESCGWRLQQVVRIEGSSGFYQPLRAVPA
ncbi:S-adenosyl-L-methionine-dependent methyltransferase [Mycena albidolilacea]|uniref:S-adenosyl-L-methionine-dependent methyltransferase n=1 Tax=Mycena albidolilacea TaxID=1033008 RepID=A0AAD7EBJ8_9AGAR|nr:S-adenosyl-L-methionine-dependent methyltransferase [Mycena albidolilacea]